ncbi:MAG: hypothetical protein GEU82_12155 [Luteitalea sp.]|nr:hypothetical protein [Luteitalea sp.]
MRYRALVSMGGLVIVIGMLPLAGGTMAGQTSKASPTAREASSPPRTADGRPDLSGVWSHNAATPFERPKELEGRELLTDAEVAILKKNATELFNGATDAAFGDEVFIAALKEAKDHKSYDTEVGNYNHFWIVDREFDNRTSLIVDPPDGRLPPLTAEAKERNAAAAEYSRVHYADGPEDVPHNCYGGNVPLLGAGYNNYYQILQTPTNVAIHMEMMHDTRIVPVDGQAKLSDTIRQRLGSARGRWEGDTLVVETTNFRGNRRGSGRGNSATSHLTEKFTRVNASTLKYEVTVNDPATYTKPWTAVLYWKAEQKARIYEFACHEGNESMAGTLSGYRAQEKAGKKPSN